MANSKIKQILVGTTTYDIEDANAAHIASDNTFTGSNTFNNAIIAKQGIISANGDTLLDIVIDVSGQLNTESESNHISGTLTETQLDLIRTSMSRTALDVGGIIVNFINGTYDSSSRTGNVIYATNYINGSDTDDEGTLIDPQGITYFVSVNLSTGAIEASGGQLRFGVHIISLDSTIGSTNTSGTLSETDLKIIKTRYQDCLITWGGIVFRPFKLLDGNAYYQMVYLGGKTYIVNVVEINLTTGAYTVQSENNPIVTELPTNHVTTDTTQTITGSKTFSGALNIPSGTVVGRTNDNPSLVLGNNAAYYYKNKIVYKDSSGSTQTLTFPAKSGTLATTADITAISIEDIDTICGQVILNSENVNL